MITVIPDGSALIQMVNFLILLFALNMVLYKPIRNVLIERKAKIEGMRGDAHKAANDMVAGEESYKNGLKQARTEGLSKKETFIEEATQEEKEIIDRINKKAQANLAELNAQVAQEPEQARNALDGEVEAFAKAIGERILGRAC